MMSLLKMIVAIIFLFPMTLLNASNLEKAPPEIRVGLFLHLCDVMHRREGHNSLWWALMFDSPYKNRIDGHSLNLLSVEFDLHLLSGERLEEESIHVARLCLPVYETKVEIKQKLERFFDRQRWFTWFSSVFPKFRDTSAEDRASVFALTTQYGDQFVVSHADVSTYLMFFQQKDYYSLSIIDDAWPDVHKILQAIEPGLLAAWETFFHD